MSDSPSASSVFGPYAGEWLEDKAIDPSMETPSGGPVRPDCVVWKRPRRKFVVIGDFGIEELHEGADLTLDMVLRYRFPDVDEVGEKIGRTYDIAVFEDERLVAIVTQGDGIKPIIRRVRRPETTIVTQGERSRFTPEERT